MKTNTDTLSRSGGHLACRRGRHPAARTSTRMFQHDGRPAGQDARLWSLDVLAGPGERDAKGVSHTSPGQRPGFIAPNMIASAEGATHPSPARTPISRIPSIPHASVMKQAVGLQRQKRDGEPRALPWAGMRDAFGVRIMSHTECPNSTARTECSPYPRQCLTGWCVTLAHGSGQIHHCDVQAEKVVVGRRRLIGGRGRVVYAAGGTRARV